MSEELTPEEKEEVKEILGYGSSVPNSQQNVHTFLHNVATAEDTTKLGNLKEEEIGVMTNPIRSYKHLGLFARKVMRKDDLADFFESNSEIGTSTSLSREGFLVDRAVVQKRELRDTTSKPKAQNKGWFKGKNQNQGDVNAQAL